MDVDAVVAWVDGSDPKHEAKRQEWLARESGRLIKKAAIPLRFSDNGELRYCLRSIRNHAPWISTIYLITDAQTPNFLDRHAAAALGVRIVDHKTVFRHRAHFLPTFNSCAIETMMWQIPDLSERFIYFNDDMFFCGVLQPNDFFRDDKVVLRGRKVDWTTRPTRDAHGRAQRLGATLAGSDLRHGLLEAHVPYPVRRSVMQSLAARLPDEFDRNAAQRFREHGTFTPIAMHNAECLQRGLAVVIAGADTAYITARACHELDGDQLREKFAPVLQETKTLFCINDLGAMREKVPEIDSLMAQAVGGPLPFEKDRATMGSILFRIYARLYAVVRHRGPRRLRKLLDRKRLRQKADMVEINGTA